MKFGVRSDKGKVREINEDGYNIIAGYPGVPVSFVIADGMGGHNSGEIASKAAVDFVSNYILEFPKIVSEEVNVSATIQEIMEKTNLHVYQKSCEDEAYHGMGTTLIIAVVYNKKLFIGHVGDSRVYLIRDDQIKRLTVDHSFIEELIRNGSLTREEAENHPNKNVITRALGCSESLQIDTYSYNMKAEDIFVICTDGLTNKVSDEDIKHIVVKYEDPEAACEELVNKANAEGGDDNITVIVFTSN